VPATGIGATNLVDWEEGSKTIMGINLQNHHSQIGEKPTGEMDFLREISMEIWLIFKAMQFTGTPNSAYFVFHQINSAYLCFPFIPLKFFSIFFSIWIFYVLGMAS
jgi:hypothetical protein